MKVISYFEGQTRLNMAWDEIRPKSGVPAATLVSLLQETYGFEQSAPSPTAQDGGMYLPILGHGRFSFQGENASINYIDFQPDAFVVQCPHTDMSNALIDELLDLLVERLGFRLPNGARSKVYKSTIVADLGRDLIGFLPIWTKVINRFLELKGAGCLPLKPFSLRFGTMAQDILSDNDIVFERRFTAPEGENWIYSQMSLDSNKHEELLVFIENVFGLESVCP